ncbi:flagellar basal-body rod protein FlgC [Rhizobium sp. RU35A]|uniref:Flagellar basal body rod protein n=1 Tax=Rhizobium straminoryzae TaxID=1387186 RepID=A0A549SLY9_9HYPH|nr:MULTISPECIES: flagellar basal body protein [Rhizobium]TRL30650.1 flagellar basal body rod protein [Rhizobium straminoryzae]SIQ77310.1 flagellar basal-body rod protein FlgC [Rhizobium sp. RU35A]
MTLSAVSNTALSGMQAQLMRLSATANNVANADTTGYSRLSTQFSTSPTGGVTAQVKPSDTAQGSEPLQDMLAQTEASIGFRANAMVFETGADLWQMLSSINRS